jgi:hypothetical protein
VHCQVPSVEELPGRGDCGPSHVGVLIVHELADGGADRRPGRPERDHLRTFRQREAVLRSEAHGLVIDVTSHVTEPVQQDRILVVDPFEMAQRAGLTSRSASVSWASARGMSSALPPAWSSAAHRDCPRSVDGSGSG